MEKEKKKILIIEDELSLLEALNDKFSREDFLVFRAVNGEEGLSLAFKEQPDLILLDIVMPKVNGMTVFKKLRMDKNRWARQVPVIILTNIENFKEVVEAFEFDICGSERKRFRGRSLNIIKKGITGYLNSRLNNGGCDFLIKSDCKIESIVKLAKKRLRVYRV